MDNTRKKLEDALIRLIFLDPLLNEFASFVKLHEETADGIMKKMPTIGVRVDHSFVHIHYVPDYIDAKSKDDLVFLMKHELYHVVLGHVFYHLKDLDRSNIAADIEINQHPYTSVPHTMKDNAQTFDKYKLPAGEIREMYYKMLPEEDGEGKGGGEGQGMDNHEQWGGEQADTDQEIWKERVQQAVANAQARGNISGGMAEKIMARWVKRRDVIKILKRLVGKSISASVFEASYWKKENKRHPEWHGTKDTYAPKIAIAIDTSGSMSSEMLEHAFSVTRWIKRQGFDAKIIQCDSDVKQVSNIAKLGKEINVLGRGGTSSIPVFNWIDKNYKNPDILIYFSDMEIDFPNTKPKYKVLWCNTNKSGGRRPPFGREIQL